MQAQTPEVSAEKATTPAEQRLVSVEQLKKIHRDLDACQKVIWLAGCRPRGYGFDPSYVTDAQERLKEIEALLEEPTQAQTELVEARDTQRLDFMLHGRRKIVVERLPHDNLAIYVEEGFMGDKRYPAVNYSGNWEQGSTEDLEIKREAIDAALAAQGGSNA